MDWLAQNWVWVLIGIAFVVMHMFGHGGHGGGHVGHGGSNGGYGGGGDKESTPAEPPGKKAPEAHRH